MTAVVRCCISEQNNNNNGKEEREQQVCCNKLKAEEFHITIKSPSLSTDQLHTLVKLWVEEYQDFRSADISSTRGRLRYFVMNNKSQGCSTGGNSSSYGSSDYSEFPVEPEATVYKVYFPERDDIFKRLDFYAKNETWYAQHGIPYNMGFILQDWAGCEKASIVKAIANHTQRHVISISLTLIDTCKELLNIVHGEHVNGRKIPMNKRLYVLKDIDKIMMSSNDNESRRSSQVAVATEAVIKEASGKQRSRKRSVYKGKYDSTGGGGGGTVGEEDAVVDETTATAADEKHVRLDNGSHQKNMLQWMDLDLWDVLEDIMETDGCMLAITTKYTKRMEAILTRRNSSSRGQQQQTAAEAAAETIDVKYSRLYTCDLVY